MPRTGSNEGPDFMISMISNRDRRGGSFAGASNEDGAGQGATTTLNTPPPSTSNSTGGGNNNNSSSGGPMRRTSADTISMGGVSDRNRNHPSLQVVERTNSGTSTVMNPHAREPIAGLSPPSEQSLLHASPLRTHMDTEGARETTGGAGTSSIATTSSMVKPPRPPSSNDSPTHRATESNSGSGSGMTGAGSALDGAAMVRTPWMVGGVFKEMTSDELNRLPKDERKAYYEAKKATLGVKPNAPMPKTKAERRAIQVRSEGSLCPSRSPSLLVI